MKIKMPVSVLNVNLCSSSFVSFLKGLSINAKVITLIVFLTLRHEEEMYKTLLSDYDNRQRELVLENTELRKVLQQMKRDIVTILSSRKPTPKGEKNEDGIIQVRHVFFLTTLFPGFTLHCMMANFFSPAVDLELYFDSCSSLLSVL